MRNQILDNSLLSSCRATFAGEAPGSGCQAHCTLAAPESIPKPSRNFLSDISIQFDRLPALLPAFQGKLPQVETA